MDYYNVLGVERSATKDDIKRAYRRMAHKFHPDKEGGNEEKFKQVNEAYQILGDETKRAQYDQFGQTSEGTPGGQGFSGFNVNFEDLGGVGDIFEQFFGGGSRTRRAVRRGDDVAVDLTLDFIESASEQQRDITLRLHHTCERCHGNGAEPGTPIKECRTCKGTGSVQTTRQTMFGIFAQTTVCTVCQGEGKQAATACRDCRGEGRVRGSKTLNLKVPAGIADGQTIRIGGKGEAPTKGGLSGDLYVTVHVTPHPQLTRHGDNVHVTAEISFADAALGTNIEVPTLQGNQAVKIPAGTQPQHVITLPGAGFPNVQGGRTGDERVTVKVAVPRSLSRQQRQLLEEFKTTRQKSFFRRR